MRYIAAFVLLMLPASLRAQSAVYVPYKNKSLWSAETLYVGASFLYTGSTTSKVATKWGWKFGTAVPIQVTLKGNEAGWRGELWANVQSATGKVETVYLFSNHDAPGTTVDLRKKLSFVIPTGSEIAFEYRVIESLTSSWPLTDEDMKPKYSGPNRGSDKYHSPATSDNMPNPNWRFGNRWSVVGRAPSGDLEFGFEDCTQDRSDMDFDDVVFTVSNLEIGVFNRKLLTKDLVR